MNGPGPAVDSLLRRFAIATLSLLGLLPWSSATASSPADDPPPNIVLCMGDDHGWDETSYQGHPHLKTPNLDAMAAAGLRLDRFYAAHPTCSPTRGSVLTGRHPNRYATFRPNYSIRPRELTIAAMLKEVGYATAHFGKWHLGPVKAESPTSPGAMGFDTWLSHDNFFELDPLLSRDGGPPTKIPGESSEILIEAATQFMDECQKRSQPFFVVIWFGSPHEPYSGLDADLRLYDAVRAEFAGETVRLTSNQTGRQTERPLGEVLRERYAEISALDRAMGTLRSWLREHDVHEQTMLWYCGDNGSPSGASKTLPLRGQKATLYEGGIRVPGIVEWPAVITRGSQSNIPAVTSDILPTICAAVDIPLPSRPLDGVNLLPLFRDEAFERGSPLCFWRFSPPASGGAGETIERPLQQGTTPLVKLMAGKATRDFTNPQVTSYAKSDFAGSRAVMRGKWKLIVHQSRGEPPRVQLYDLETDPREQTNLAAEQKAVVESLREYLTAWQRSVLESLVGADYHEAP
jgi:arylsulfatase A-like enzyme